jgi:hypothetical protein
MQSSPQPADLLSSLSLSSASRTHSASGSLSSSQQLPNYSGREPGTLYAFDFLCSRTTTTAAEYFRSRSLPPRARCLRGQRRPPCITRGAWRACVARYARTSGVPPSRSRSVRGRVQPQRAVHCVSHAPRGRLDLPAHPASRRLAASAVLAADTNPVLSALVLDTMDGHGIVWPYGLPVAHARPRSPRIEFDPPATLGPTPDGPALTTVTAAAGARYAAPACANHPRAYPCSTASGKSRYPAPRRPTFRALTT